GGFVWVGSYNTSTIEKVSLTDGSVVQRVDLAKQGVGVSEITGLAFIDAATLLVSCSDCRVQLVHLPSPPPPPVPVLNNLVATRTSGHAANESFSSANIGQTITLVGTNFNSSTTVLFATRDNGGNEGTTSVVPSAISADGTRMQIVVPDHAESGPVQLAY